MFPSAATYTISAFFGCIATFPISPAFGNPMCCHVSPMSVDLYIPFPIEIFPLGSADPVPTYTIFSSEGATAIAPIDPTVICPSETLFHEFPASVVFQTPPPVVPMKNV